jgi:hypothetical protein
VVGTAIPEIAGTTVGRTESTQLPFVAGIIAALGTFPTIERTAKAVLIVRFQAFTVTTRALGLWLAELIGVADGLAAAAYPASCATPVGTTFLAIASGLAETFSIGVTGKALVTFSANPATAVGSAILLSAVGQTLTGTGINEPLAKPQSLLHETASLRLPVILALGNNAPENLFDIFTDPNGQLRQAFGNAVDFGIFTGVLKGTIVGILAGPDRPGAAHTFQTRRSYGARLCHRPAAPILHTVSSRIPLTQGTTRFASEVGRTDIATKDPIDWHSLRRQVNGDHIRPRAVPRTGVRCHDLLDSINGAGKVHGHRISAARRTRQHRGTDEPIENSHYIPLRLVFRPFHLLRPAGIGRRCGYSRFYVSTYFKYAFDRKPLRSLRRHDARSASQRKKGETPVR